MKESWIGRRLRVTSARHKVAIVTVVCVFSFLATFVSLPDNVLATDHGGWISQDETWDKTGNDHYIVKDVRVMPSVTLTITQGVNVSFHPGTSLYVDGDLVVSGTVSEPVTFTSFAFNPQPGDWGSIHFNATAGNQPPSSQIKNATIEYGSTAIYANNRTLAIYNSVVRYNLLGIDSYYASVMVDMNSIHNNDNDGVSWTGLFPSYPSSITVNNITNNGGNGINGSAGAIVSITSNNISFNKYGIHFVDSTPATSHNNVKNNSEDGIYFLRSGNGTFISNNTIANNSKNGIWVNISTVLIDNNTIDHNGLNGTYGIYYGGTMENNTVFSNPGSGIYLVNSSGSFLQFNNVTLNGIHGVYSYNSSLTVRKNNITYNSPSGLCFPYCAYFGIYANQGSNIQIDHNGIENNSVSGIYLHYVTEANVTDNIVSDHFNVGIYAKGSSRVNVSWNSLVRNRDDVGIKFYQQPQKLSRIENNTIVGEVGTSTAIILWDYGSSTMIANNSLKNVWRGMYLADSSARVFNNDIQNVSNVAISLDDYWVHGHSSNEDVFNNTITSSLVGIYLDVETGESASPYIHNNTITGDATSVSGIHIWATWGSATPTIKYNTVTNHTGQDGIFVFGNAHPQIINNTIAGNSIGIWVGKEGPNATIHGSNIYNNTYRGVFKAYEPGVIVNATENWWGHSSGPFHRTKNPFGSGDEVSDGVDFVPWLTVPAF